MPITDEEIAELKRISKKNRIDTVEVTGWCGGSHIGGSLSMMDLVTILYWRYLEIRPEDPEWDERDRFVLSKGHGGVGHAVVLANRGYYDAEQLKDFNKTGSPFGMHLDGNKVLGVDVSTGSLGHGMSMALGLALGARVRKMPWLTYCVVGDGECNEGSIWEAAMAAAHYKTGNLIVLVDRNRMMIDGPTEEVMALEPLADKWRAFGWEVRETDGHDFRQLADAIDYAIAYEDGPVVIICNTIKGKGVDFMENDPAWHYGGLSAELVRKAKASLERE